jgi:hypothetical protein
MIDETGMRSCTAEKEEDIHRNSGPFDCGGVVVRCEYIRTITFICRIFEVICLVHPL